MSRKKQKSVLREGHNLHDGFFKKIFKNTNYLMQLLRMIFPPKFIAALDAESLTIKDGILLKRAGGEIRTDLTAEARFKGTDTEIAITFILEHKSYRDPEVILQTMEYYLIARREQLKRKSRRKGAVRNLVLPVVLICCKDKDFEPPKDDLSLEFGDEEIPPVLEEYRYLFRHMPCLTVNLRKLQLDNFWEDAKCAVTAVQGMSEVWHANDDTVAALLTKGRLLSPEDGAFILENLSVYYENADNAIGEGDFYRVDRERWPDLAQEERLETMLETQSDRAKQLGIEQGKQLGIEQGKQQGKQLGIEQGKLEMVRRFLMEGVDERIICKASQLSKQELAKIKRDLNRS